MTTAIEPIATVVPKGHPQRPNYEAYVRIKNARTKAQRQKDQRTKVRALIALARLAPCTDCGLEDPRVMDFDHVRGEKLFPLAHAVRRGSIRQTQAELAKCDVVCANCHRIRHFDREAVVS